MNEIEEVNNKDTADYNQEETENSETTDDIPIWTNSRYSTLSPAAVNMLYTLHELNENEYDLNFRKEALSRHALLQGKAADTKKLGRVETYITSFEEQGWTSRINENGKNIFKFTDAGEQAYTIIKHVPDYLKFFPYFLIEIISRYQQWNPSRRGESYLSKGDIFPYWALFKIMRENENYISIDEFCRFICKVRNMNELTNVNTTIRKYRSFLKENKDQNIITSEFGPKISENRASPLYFMHRAGIGYEYFSNFGKGILIKDENLCPLGTTIYRINSDYVPFIDNILNDPPKNLPQTIDAKQWFAHYGRAITQPIQDTIVDSDSIWKEIKTNLLDKGKRRIILSGPPGTSKTWYAEKIAEKISKGDKSCIEKVQFHQSYSYEDFVAGYAPSKTGFEVKKKIFLTFCERALANPGKMHILIIDEITRGDPSRIFGEILTYLEYPDRPIKLMYFDEEEFFMPENLIILATMNPFDRSISDLDIMLERRFEIFRMPPRSEILEKMLKENGATDSLISQIKVFFDEVQEVYSDVGLGHAYFKDVRDEQDLRNLWRYQLENIFSKHFFFEKDKINKVKESFPWSDSE